MYINPFIAGVLTVVFIEVMFVLIFIAHSIKIVTREDNDDYREVHEQSEDDNDKDFQ